MKKITDFLELLQKIEKDHVLSGSKRLFAKGKIYQYDKCFRTGIRSKYRPMINKAGLKKPLIKIAK